MKFTFEILIKDKKIEKALLLNSKLFPFLVTLTYFFLMLETYMYIGFLSRFFLVDSRHFLVVSIISALLLVFSRKESKLSKEQIFLNKLVLQVNKLLFPLTLIFYIIMQVSEVVNYNNYVFSTFHLQPEVFFNIVLFSGVLFIIDMIHKRKKEMDQIKKAVKMIIEGYKTSPFQIVLKILIVTFLLIYFLLGLTKTMNNLVNSSFYIVTHRDDSYDDKIRRRWGFYYDFMKFVDERTDSGSTIVVPPQQGPWLTVGNAGLGRYFVYPKKILNGGYDYLPKNDFDYVVIAWGGWLVGDKKRYGWPKVPVVAEKIWYINSNLEIKEFTEDYVPDDPKNENGWGLIKVKDL